MGKRRCHYAEVWEKEYPWLSSVKGDRFSAFCSVCKVKFDVSRGGKAHVASHSKGSKHIARDKVRKSSSDVGVLFRTVSSDQLNVPLSRHDNSSAGDAAGNPNNPPTSTSSEQTDDLACNPSTSSISKASVSCQNLPASTSKAPFGILKRSVTKAELIHVMTCIKANVSFRASDVLGKMFSVMFSDSTIAKEMTVGRTKFSYLLCFGLSPYFKEQLVTDLKACNWFCVMFDESLNRISQKAQMDVIVRYWSTKENRVVTKYLDSAFLYRTRASDLLDALLTCLLDVGIRKLLAVSMDGPSVNWRLLSELMNKKQEEGMPGLVNVGSCGLHVVHGASAVGESKTEWDLKTVLSSAYYLFKDSPKRRSDFIQITSTSTFPLKFCAVRWCENLNVARRFVDLIPALEKYCREVDPKPHHLKSFQHIEKALKDPLLKAKMGFFISVQLLILPFLKKYQSAKPLAPFLYGDLYELLTSLAARYLKSSITEQVSSCADLMAAIKSSGDEDLKSPPDVGIAAQVELQQMESKRGINYAKLRLNFYNDCRKYLIFMCKKLVERSPLKYPITKQVQSLNPVFWSRYPVAAKELFRDMMQTLIKLEVISDVVEAELGVQQYCKFIDASKTLGETFNCAEQRLDEFYCSCQQGQENSAMLEVIRMMLLLPHGNAPVESGFSVQDSQMCENLLERTMVAKRRVHDSIESYDGIPDLVDDQMLKAVKGAHKRYFQYLEKKQSEKTAKVCREEASKKRKAQALQEVKEIEMRASAALEEAAKKRKQIAEGLF